MKVKISTDHKIGYQLLQLRKFINETAQHLAFDFSEAHFLPPLIGAYFTIRFNKELRSQYNNLSSYHEKLFFPSGLEAKDHYLIAKYLNLEYLPYIKFNTSKNPELSNQRENLLSLAGRNITRHFSLNHETGIIYMISELTDNIVDHANSNFGIITYKFFEEQAFIDICIADGGIGVMGSYQQYSLSDKYKFIDNSIIALDSLIKGNSTKLEYQDERGFGVHTSRRMLIEGLGGTFVLLSGNALLVNYHIADFKANYPGTIILLRIPIASLSSNFNYLDYVV